MDGCSRKAGEEVYEGAGGWWAVSRGEVERPKDAVERMAKLAQLDAAYERMDAGLGIAEKADAWDGKSAESVDESELDGVGGI